MISIKWSVGDVVLFGKFKNKKMTIKKIGVDDHGDPTINDRPLLKYRSIKQEEFKMGMERLEQLLSELSEGMAGRVNAIMKDLGFDKQSDYVFDPGSKTIKIKTKKIASVKDIKKAIKKVYTGIKVKE